MRNSEDHVSCAQNLEVMHAFKNFPNSQFKNLNDADIILMPMFATCNKVKMERIIVFLRN